jgi:hypothetical protein
MVNMCLLSKCAAEYEEMVQNYAGWRRRAENKFARKQREF